MSKRIRTDVQFTFRVQVDSSFETEKVDVSITSNIPIDTLPTFFKQRVLEWADKFIHDAGISNPDYKDLWEDPRMKDLDKKESN